MPDMLIFKCIHKDQDQISLKVINFVIDDRCKFNVRSYVCRERFTKASILGYKQRHKRRLSHYLRLYLFKWMECI